MNKIWRRHYLTTLNDAQSYPQSEFLDLISRIIKSLKKKQDILLKIIQESQNQSFNQNQSIRKIDKIQLSIKFDKIIEQQDSHIQTLHHFKDQEYYKTKAYLYTILVRINQICQATKQKFAALKLPYWVNCYKNVKLQIMQEYNDLMHKCNYDILPLIKKFIKFQNQSICKYIPKRLNRSTSPVKITLQPIDKTFIYQRVKSAQSQSVLKPTFSLQIPKKQKLLRRILDESSKHTKTKLEISKLIESKKLISHKKSFTKNKKQTKQKQPQTFEKIYAKNFNKMYKILDVKQLQVEQSFYFRMDMQRQLKVRNQKIRQSLKEWENQHQKNKHKIKSNQF